MTWGYFSWLHILTMIAVIPILIGIHFLLKNKSEKTKTIALLCMALTGIVAIIYNLIVRKDPINNLPFHLCSLNALMLPIAVTTKNKTICNLLLLWSLGALVAIILNDEHYHYKFMDLNFIMYYFPHLFEFGVPILIFTLKLSKLDAKCIISTMLISFVTFTLVHFINVILKTNYMFSRWPINPVLYLFRSWVPYDYWYMLLCFPIILVYLCLLYHRQLIQIIKNKLQTKKESKA